MRKYAINYNRSFPDHRKTIDFTLYEEIKLNPLANLRAWKSGLTHNLAKYFPLHMCTVGLAALLVVSLWKLQNTSNIETLSQSKNNRSTYQWIHHSQNPESGYYDSILHKFENVGAGITDWSFE